MRKRGGSWNNQSINLRASNRNNNTPDNQNNNIGFRLATHPACPARCRAIAREVIAARGADTPTEEGASIDPGRAAWPGQRTLRRARASSGPPCEDQGAAHHQLMMKLPHADRAAVDLVKLRDYCLSPTHPRGRHKARVFAAALGLTAADADLLRAALLAAVQTEEAIPGEQDAYGQRYVVDFLMRGPRGQAIVRSSWIVRTGEDMPRLTSCYVQ